MGERTADEPPPDKRLTVAQAAAQLGLTEGAVRSRIKRGTLPTERISGTVYVVLGDSAPRGEPSTDQGRTNDRLIESYEGRIESLERQLEGEREARRRADHIIAALTERIPELEAPPATPQEAEGVSESGGGVEYREPTSWPETETSQSSESRRPWWRRLFGRG